MPTPHRVIDQIADSVANGVSSLITSAGGAVKGAGEEIMRGLDRPFKDLTGKIGPHRIIDAGLDGVVDAAVNWPTAGVIGSLKKVGAGICKGLDNPPEEVGIPPDLGPITELGGRRRR